MFFFSSRRRHTRWPRDWTSDVCSSDLSLKPGRSCLLEQYGHPVFLEPVRFISGEVYEWPRRHSQWTIFSLPADTSLGVSCALRAGSHSLEICGRSEERRVGKGGQVRWGRVC